MADEKDPKASAESAEEKPKRRAPRRKPKAEPKADAAATSTAAAPPVAEEPVAAAPEPEPAPAKTAAKAAAKPKAAGTTTAKPKAAGATPAKPKAAAAAPTTPKADAAETAVETPKPARRTRRKAADGPPAEPTAKTRRAPRDYGDTPPMVRAHAKYVRTSARKARLVCDHIRGKSVPEARAILAHASRDVARDWSKLLESAVANAEHNHELIGDELRIHAVKADEGPTLKRFRPRAMGRATKIRKRTSHLSITLTPRDGDK